MSVLFPCLLDRQRTLGGFSQTSQHRRKVVLIHAQFDAPIEEMGPPGLVEKRPLYVHLMKEGHSNRAVGFLGSIPTLAIVGCMDATSRVLR